MTKQILIPVSEWDERNPTVFPSLSTRVPPVPRPILPPSEVQWIITFFSSHRYCRDHMGFYHHQAVPVVWIAVMRVIAVFRSICIEPWVWLQGLLWLGIV